MRHDRLTAQKLNAHQKLTALSETDGLSDEKLGFWLRKNGHFLCDLQLWKQLAMRGLDEGRPMKMSERDHYRKQIAKLEVDLKEARAIINLQKKVRLLFPDEAENSVSAKEDKSSVTSSKPSKKAAAKKAPSKR